MRKHRTRVILVVVISGLIDSSAIVIAAALVVLPSSNAPNVGTLGHFGRAHTLATGA